MSKSIQLKNDNENMYPHPYYPVGSIYLSVNNQNPTKWFGGKWEQIAQGRTLVGVDENDVDFNIVKKIGGNKYLQRHLHRGIHYMGLESANNLALNSGNKGYRIPYEGSWSDTGGAGTGAEELVTNYPGDGNSENLQPYFTCYIWLRIV